MNLATRPALESSRLPGVRPRRRWPWLVAGILTAALVAIATLTAAFQSGFPWRMREGDRDHVYESAAGSLRYQVHVPPHYDGTTRLPVIVAIHGCGMTGFGWNPMKSATQLNTLADREGLIVVYPTQRVFRSAVNCGNSGDPREQHRHDRGLPKVRGSVEPAIGVPDRLAPLDPVPGTGSSMAREPEPSEWRIRSMAWSTREVADLAGTTVNTVRHYHRVGLLEEPDRMSNGYKQYQVRHLVRLLQIRRLRDLGVPLDQIEQVGSSGEAPADALRALDADLATSIERLQRARAEIEAILQGSTVTDVPAGFERVATKLSSPERSLMLIYAQLFDERAMADVRQMLEDEPDDASAGFNTLPPDADETRRQQLAEQFAPMLTQHLADYAWLSDPTDHLSKSPRIAENTFLESIVALFNPAQLDVLARASVLAKQQRQDAATPDPGRSWPLNER